MSDLQPSHQLLKEQQRLLYRNSLLPIFISLVIGALLCWLQFGDADTDVLLLWLAALLLATAIRLAAIVLTITAEKSGRPSPHLYPLFLAGTWLAAMVWGGASLTIFPENNPASQAVFIIVIVGISAAAIPSLCPSWPAISGFLALCLLPLATQLILVHRQGGLLPGFLVILFLLVSLFSARRLNHNIAENITLRLESVEKERVLRQSEERYQKVAQELSRRTSYDMLTDLPNRRLLLEYLHQEVARSVRHHQHGALLCLDLDNFNTINDALGHSAGDNLLRQVAARLTDCLRAEDTAARMGGDEFTLLLSHLDPAIDQAARQVEDVTRRLTERMAVPFFIAEQQLTISFSMGISLFPEADKIPEDILKQADTALNQAKAAGQGTFRFFQPEMQGAADRRLRLHTDIRKAIDNEELTLYYQPQVTADGRLAGAEALLRWIHPERGMIAPLEFITIAEETGIIVDIGEYVLEKTCRSIRIWQDAGLLAPSQSIAVNISAREFSAPSFVNRVLDTLSRTGAHPHHLDIELTEGSLLTSVEETIAKMTLLRSRGIRFSVDDFGTGYSSLSYLRTLPLHTLKIDRSFVNDIKPDSSEFTLVTTIITMAHSLGLQVIAEGVETAEQLRYLAEKECQLYQGYYFSRPIPVEEFTKLLRSGKLAG